MTKSTKEAEKPQKIKLTKTQWFNKYVMPVFTFLIGIVALAVLLGLAGRGLSMYLKDLSDTTRAVASVIGVSLLAYCVAALGRLFSK
jgi:hypothetical protein